MTPEQQAAYIIAQAAEAMIRAMGMDAENQKRRSQGYTPAYTEAAFIELLAGYALGHNSVIGYFTGR